MKEQLQKVKEFHQAFNIKDNNSPSLNVNWGLRADLLDEELLEYIDANRERNLVEVLDALADQLYIVYGTIISHGLQDVIEEAFDRVHKSNMSKLGEDGKPIINGEGYLDTSRPLGKVLKSKNYVPVDLKDLV